MLKFFWLFSFLVFVSIFRFGISIFRQFRFIYLEKFRMSSKPVLNSGNFRLARLFVITFCSYVGSAGIFASIKQVASSKDFYLVLETGKPIRFEDYRPGKWLDTVIYPIFDRDERITRVAVMAGANITK